MRQSSRSFRRLTAGGVFTVGTLLVGVLVVTGLGSTAPAIGSVEARPPVATASTAATPAPTTSTTPPTTTPAPTPTTIARAVAAAPPTTTPAFASGNSQLDALLATLPPVLFAAGARVHFGYNPMDTCCHAGGYNPEPNEVWVSERAFASTARLTYVTAHELGHSVHLHSARGAALTAAVAGAPVVRAGSPWDVSEKVADCVAWVLYPQATAASGITYWSCPDPWRSQVRAALA